MLMWLDAVRPWRRPARSGVRVKEGLRGLVVPDRGGRPVVFVLCEQATRYYRVMTRSEWMPALVGEVI